MTHINGSGWMPVFAAWAALGLAGTNAHAQCYEYEVAAVIEHPSCSPYLAFVNPKAINDHGQVVGYVDCFGNRRAFLWDAGEITVLPNPPGFTESEASDINNAGQITVENFIWEDGQYIDIGFIPGANRTYAEAINEQGQVTGYSLNTSTGIPPASAILWAEGQLTNLAPLISTEDHNAADINNGGTIIGTFPLSGTKWNESWVLTGQSVEFLNFDNACGAIAEDINDAGQISGRLRHPITDCSATSNPFYDRAVVWSNGELTELPLLPGDDPDDTDIETDDTVITGDLRMFGQYSRPGTSNDTVFVWDDGEMRDLFDLVAPYPGMLQIRLVGDFNAHGQVVVTAKMQVPDSLDTTYSALVLNPIAPPDADFDNSGRVGVEDFFLLLQHWGACDPCIADLNCNGQVDVVDFFAVLQDWGSMY
jgi:probable HAF family extracellular repeat protein